MKPNLFTISASAPFLEVLVDALLDGRLVKGYPASREPLEIARATLYLPTQRACRVARDVFLKQLGTDAAILPRIVPLGGIDEDDIAFAEAAKAELPEQALTIPEAMSGLSRLMPLSALILKWATTIAPKQRGHVPLVASNPVTAFRLAQDLARLMDDMTTRQVPWGALDDLVPDEHDRYWDLTLGFLKFIREQWPAILAGGNRIEPAERRDLLIKAETERLAKASDPIIAAGSTGSIPATATLLDTIAKLPHGAVVLPGLDTDLDDTSWDAILSETDASHGHPQFALASLIKRIGIMRADIVTLAKPAPHGRERVTSEALRPALASQLWQALPNDTAFGTRADAAIKDIAVIEAANAEEEALAIAVTLREAVETPGKTAALVTPDVALGRRVAALLARWNVAVDDSRGQSLADLPEGVFARLVADVARHKFAPIPLLSLLKHPANKSESPFDPHAVSVLERAVLRGTRPTEGSKGLIGALDDIRAQIELGRAGKACGLHRSDPRLALSDADLDAASALMVALQHHMAPLEQLTDAQPIGVFAAKHAEALTALGGMTRELQTTFDELTTAEALDVTASDYAELFHLAIADRTIHRAPADARVRIFGLLEARLQHVDRLVLGGLVEAVWPPEAQADAWLSRPMRRQLGLDLPERRIGLSAHDFAQALGAREVILSRPAKLGGEPTVASRFVQRLAAVLGDVRWKAAQQTGAHYVALARRLDEAETVTPAQRPAPKPPFEARPRRLSVTEVEDLLRDPYTIYARHVLKLQPLDDIDAPIDAAARGTFIHDSLAELDQTYKDKLPDNALASLLDIGQRHFKPLENFPEAKAFWWPRFERIAAWFVMFDAKRRSGAQALSIEVGGSIPIPFGNETFTLTVRADRIECLADGRYAIIDYKTGAPPSDNQVSAGLSPQLTLEAAILRDGGFKDIPAGGSVSELLYVRLSGGVEAGEERSVKFKDSAPDVKADEALAELTKVLAQFADPNNPYLSLRHPMWKNHYGTYDHLARIKEWSLTGGLDEEAGE
ncbi:double-strand break repair protein AddB [Undibacter mobilis]|uniref:Double-strand break repair protein AddB n=1 Tax=Undibacter mobilis TaxID=2292256 RepID=A0A371B991_9BRAD|nr:double-strand break repair protein AddB [Undibacter mobilis]RDV04148.1 double-strand break repair protein AddB [Undibacter mobilis]